MINSTCYLVNRSPSIPINYRTPEEKWSGSLSNYGNLRFFFSCPTYTHVNASKLEPRTRKCILLGYADEVKGYKLW